MSYKKIYMSFNIKRHIHARVIFRCVRGRSLVCWDMPSLSDVKNRLQSTNGLVKSFTCTWGAMGYGARGLDDGISGKLTEWFDAILVFNIHQCALTGMQHLQAYKKKDTAKDTAKHFGENVVRLHGMPISIVSDQDVRLSSHFWSALQQRLGTDLRYTTAHMPKANSKVERVNAVLGDVLRSMGSFAGKEWAHNLDLAEFAILRRACGGRPGGRDVCYNNWYTRHRRTGKAKIWNWLKFSAPVFKCCFQPRISIWKWLHASLHQSSWDRLRFWRHQHASNPNVMWLQLPLAFKIHMPIHLKDIKRDHTRTARLGGR